MTLKEQLKTLLARLAELGSKEDLSDEELKELEIGPARAKALRVSIDNEDLEEAEEAEALEVAEKVAQDAIDNAVAEAQLQADVDRAEELGVPEDYEGTTDEWVAEQLAKTGKAPRPLAPSGGAPEDDAEPRFEVGSEFDRVHTFDLAVRYETMKAFGGQPSERFFKALVDRVGQMAEEEDELYTKNGKPVTVPAIDWDYLQPVNISREELRNDRVGSGADKAKDVISKRGYDQFKELSVKANELVYSTQSGFGDQWVPTLMNASLWRTVRLNAAVLAQFEQFDMPSQPYDYPAESTDPTLYKVAETTAESQLVIDAGPFTDSKLGTAKVTFSAGKMGAISYWSEEQEEDGIIAFEPQIRDQYGIKIAHGIDEILISGDETTATTNIFSSGSTNTTSHLLILDGLRHEPMITTTADKRDAGALTIDDFGATAALMGTAGKFGLSPSDMLWLMDGGVWHKARLLGEVLTQDKFGSMATVFNGQLGSLFGSPIIVSEDYSLTDATGHIDGTAGDNVLGSFMGINKRGIKVGWRRRPRVRVERLPFADAAYIVASARFDIGFKEAGFVGLSYNITV